MVSPHLIAVPLTIVPAFGLLWYMLRRYEGYFEDARVFFALIVGFFVGLLLAFLENVIFRFDDPSFIDAAGVAYAFAYYVAGYALLETLAKVVVLGTGRFRRRKDTPYYGAPLGIGCGAMLALQYVALGFQRLQDLDAPFNAEYVTTVTLLVALAAATVLVSAGSAIWVGRGAAEGRLWNGVLWGALLQMPLLLALWTSRIEGVWPVRLSALAAVAYGTVLVVNAQRKILDKIVPPEIRDQVRRERRRELRQKE